MDLKTLIKEGWPVHRETGELLDNRIAIVSRIMGLLSAPSMNTIEDLSAFDGLSAQEIFAPPPQAPEVRLLPALLSRRPGHGVEDFAFRSQYEPISPAYRKRYEAEPELHTVRGQLMTRDRREPGRGSGPTLIYLHGWAQPGVTFERLTLLPALMRALDMDVLFLDLPFHGRRKPAGARFHGERFLSADLVRMAEAFRQTIMDVRSLLVWLEEEGRGPVGLAGVSLGGTLAMLAACVEERLWFTAPIIGHLGLAEAVRDAPILLKMRGELADMGVDHDSLSDLLGKIGLGGLAPLLPPERIFIVGARHDTYITPDILEKQWEDWGRPSIYWYEGGHMMIPLFMGPIMKAMGAFVRGLPRRAG